MIKIDTILKDVKTVAIAGHMRPDGDCVGSCIGLYLYIKENFKDVEADVYLETIPKDFMILKSSEEIKNEYEEDKEYDLFLSLDCADRQRLRNAVKYFDTAKKTICIDHHISNHGFADENYVVPEASSTSELVFGLLEEEKISKDAAEAIYLGIVHDTGVFHYQSTSSKTMMIAGKLMDKGIDYTKIVDDTFFRKTYVQNQILGRTLLASILLLDGKCIVSSLSAKEMAFYGVTSGDLEGVVSQLRITEGVEAAIFFYETAPQEHKISMRSNGLVDVSKIAQYFGGGGHKMAAGCSMTGTAHDVVNNLTPHIEQQLKQAND